MRLDSLASAAIDHTPAPTALDGDSTVPPRSPTRGRWTIAAAVVGTAALVIASARGAFAPRASAASADTSPGPLAPSLVLSEEPAPEPRGEPSAKGVDPAASSDLAAVGDRKSAPSGRVGAAARSGSASPGAPRSGEPRSTRTGRTNHCLAP